MAYFLLACGEIPNSFLLDFTRLVNKEEIKGKFSLLPYPAGLGSIEKGLEGFKKKDVEESISIVKDEITPSFDITPDILTHTLVLDLKTDRLLDISEKVVAIIRLIIMGFYKKLKLIRGLR